MERNSTLPPLFPGNQSYPNGTCSRDNVLKTVVFPVLYSFLFLLGLILNSVAAWVFFRIPSKSHFIIYLKNIVVADVVMTFTFPFKVWFAWYCLLSYRDNCHSLINRCRHHQLICTYVMLFVQHPKKGLTTMFCFVFCFCFFPGVIRLQHGFHRPAYIRVPGFLRALLPHHVHQHPLLWPHQHWPLPEDPQTFSGHQFGALGPS